MQRTLSVITLFMLTILGAQAETLFSRTTGSGCKDYSKPDLGYWVCPGPAGYAVAFMDEGNIAGLVIGLAHSVRKAPTSAQWLGAGQVFGERVQWVMQEGLPKAAVLRIWRRKGVDDSTEVQELVVYVIDGMRACAHDTIDSRRPKANDLALALAEQAAGSGCPKSSSD